MSEQFFTKAQRDFVKNNLRVGSGYIIVKSDEGVTAYAPIYIERESGNVYNPVTGKPMIILLGGDDAEQCVHTDPPSALVSAAGSENSAGG